MKRSLQEIIELVVFGLIALLLGTALLWLVGAVFGLVGTVLGWLAGLLWALLRFVVPVALIAGAVVLLVRAARGRTEGEVPQTAGPAAPASAAPTMDAAPTVDAAPPVVVAPQVAVAPATEPVDEEVAAVEEHAAAEPTVSTPAFDDDVDPDRRAD